MENKIKADFKAIQELASNPELLKKYSTFNSELIGRVLENFVSAIENEVYSFQHATQDTIKWETTVFGSETFSARYNVKMIVRGSQKNRYYRDMTDTEDSICELVQDGTAILLQKKEGYSPNNIQFYSSYYGRLEKHIDYGRFEYVKKFIDEVIVYRFNNRLDSISERELLILVSDFISRNGELIANNFILKIKRNEGEQAKRLIEEQEKHNRKVEEIEFEKMLQNGVTSTFTTKLIDRLQEAASTDTGISKLMNQIEILYDGNKDVATMTYEDPFISTENIFISKINIQASIKSYFDDSDQDYHFHQFIDIDLIDDGLIGIIDISNSDQIDHSFLSNHGVYFHFEDGLCKVDKISDNYLRVLFLPNKCNYKHKPINHYAWIAAMLADEISGSKVSNHGKQDKQVSYKTEWNYTDKAAEMLAYAKKIELLTYFSDNQLELYKKKVMVKK